MKETLNSRIVVLDFETAVCTVYENVSVKDFMEPESFISRNGHKTSSCEWMSTTEDVEFSRIQWI